MAWAVLACAAMAPDGINARSRAAFLVYDPADLGAYTVRAANAHGGRLPGRLVGPPAVLNADRFAQLLAGPQPEPSERYYLEYPVPALGLFWAEAAVVGPAELPLVAADTEHTDVAFYQPRTHAEREIWSRLRAMVRLHVVLMAAALFGLLAVLRAGYTPKLAAGRAVWLAVLPGAVYFALMRYDVLPALATALAFRCVGRGRWGWAGAWLAVGVGLKLYPVLFLPVLVRFAWGRLNLTPRPPLRSGEGVKVHTARQWSLTPARLLPLSASERATGGEVNVLRLLVGFSAALGLIATGCVQAVGVEGALNPIRVQLNRPPELGGWGLYGRFLPTALAHSSAGRLGLLAVVVLACVVTRPADLSAVLRRCGLILLVFTQLAVFWSPQWLVWFLPLTVPLAARDRWTGWATAAVDATNYLSFPVLFHVAWPYLPGRQTVAEVLIGLRTLAWVWLGWRLLVGGRMRGGFNLADTLAAVTPPRGLKWVALEAAGDPVVQGSRALLPVTVRFEPLPDGGLEDVPQAKEPRQAVAVYSWDGRRWAPTGKLVFNLSVEQILGERRA